MVFGWCSHRSTSFSGCSHPSTSFTFFCLNLQQGYGCLTLKKHEVRPLFGPSNLDELPVGPKVCIGAGTGLGECYMTPNDRDGKVTTYSCFPSEGGHVEYAPRNDVEVSMFKFLSNKFSSNHRISVERVVSGKGLANVYEFLAAEHPTSIIHDVHEEFLKAGDQQGRVVAENATEGSLCQQAMAIMMSAYGCETGSAAIKWIPTGGLFVTGGLTPKNIKYIEGMHTDFMISYLNKGRVSPLLKRIPLFAVMVEDLGVRGAHKAAVMEYEKFLEDGGLVTKSATVEAYLREKGLALTATAALGFAFGVGLSKRR
jgi:glucokinase